ncbi:hypothetical protein [Polynucleobacter sp.]|uniref:hypothetical protein n=1 Tax=Polynucleobacter sp. TaxID=2029855 RepID=UPI00333E3A49
MAWRIPKSFDLYQNIFRARMPGELAGGAGTAGAGWLQGCTPFAAFRGAATDINDPVLIGYFFSCSYLQR